MPSKSPNPRAYLFHIRDNIILAERFIDGFDYERFRDNLPAEVKERHPEIPWADVAGAGSVYRHDYEDVRQRLVWVTVQKDLLSLKAAVEDELLRLGELP
jgi:uncharacterized protein with HEPN domain